MDTFNFELTSKNNPSLAETVLNTMYGVPSIKEEDGFKSVVRVSKAIDNPPSETEINNLHKDVLAGIRIAADIDGRLHKQFGIKIKSHTLGFAMIDGSVGPSFRNALPEARSAAVLHELFELFQEEHLITLDNNGESLPMLAEFLFTKGDDRLATFLNGFKESLEPDCSDGHALSWKSIIHHLNLQLVSPDPEENFRTFLEKRDEMTYEDKIEAIKKVIGVCEKQAQAVNNLGNTSK